MTKNYAVIMAGGSGKRLWPLSRGAKPKQFLDLFGDGTLLANTIKRLDGLIDRENILVVGGEAQRAALTEAADGLLPAENLLYEPMGRNTSACIALAAAFLAQKHPGEESVMCVLPADQYIKDGEGFRSVLADGLDIAGGGDGIVTVGIRPTFPSTGYGYIHYVDPLPGRGNAYMVSRFIEKPDEAKAREFLADGRYYWNGGMFIAKTSVMLYNIRRFLPGLYEGVMKTRDAMLAGRPEEAAAHYASVESIAIDFGVMEKCGDIVVVDGRFDWNDVGSFDAITEMSEKNADGNAIVSGRCVALNATNITLHSKRRLVAVSGVDDLVIIDTDDALYICRSGKTQSTKDIVGMLAAEGLGDMA